MHCNSNRAQNNHFFWSAIKDNEGIIIYWKPDFIRLFECIFIIEKIKMGYIGCILLDISEAVSTSAIIFGNYHLEIYKAHLGNQANLKPQKNMLIVCWKSKQIVVLNIPEYLKINLEFGIAMAQESNEFDLQILKPLENITFWTKSNRCWWININMNS